MLDFVSVGTSTKGQRVIIGPDFKVKKSKDLMVKGKSFYAIWDEKASRWTTDEYDVQRLVDQEIAAFVSEHPYADAEVQYLCNFNSGAWTRFKKYLTLLSDNAKDLDANITFPSDPPTKTRYNSKVTSYSPIPGEPVAYNRLMSVLYSEEERRKLEWSIGAILCGDGKKIQKFVVLYGEPGSGKSTVLNIIQALFEGYYVSFDAGELTSRSNSFSTEVFRTNPLVAIQHDGDLSKIESNTKLNSIVSHEELVLNEKFKAQYTSRINAFLFLGTNSPVKISDARSGLIRRLLDVSPTGNKIPVDEYNRLVDQLEFELGYIAQHCLNVYSSMGRSYYQNYRPMKMIYKTDIFFNFVESCKDVLGQAEGISLKQAFDLYKAYCDDSLLEFKMPRYKFREELKVYFEDYDEESKWYSRFNKAKLHSAKPVNIEEDPLVLNRSKSLLDVLLADRPAQLATKKGLPTTKWENVTTTLSQIDTRELHFVTLPENHVVIDFDIKDEGGHKSLALNLAAARTFPPTYTEISKSGSALHLHYIYEGDVSLLAPVYSEGIEIKSLLGNQSLRRKLTKCNGEAVRHISSGLPLKESNMINMPVVKTEKHIRSLIRKALCKDVHPGTKSNMDFIHKILDDAYNSKITYDVSDLKSKVISFAAGSTNQAEYCLKLIDKLRFKSEEESTPLEIDADGPIVIFDVEVYPNLFVVVWKKLGGDKVEWVNPTPQQIATLFDTKLVGFNNRRYDNHILYARYLGYSNAEICNVSQRIVKKDEKAFFAEAYDLSYLDLYDISSVKQSLKKFEIDLGILHMELDFPWDNDVAEDQWPIVVRYCGNDVDATEAVYWNRMQDINARHLMSKLSGLIPNKPTRAHACQIIFGNQKKQQPLVYTNLAEQFPGYSYSYGKSTYRGENPGEGGYVYAEPGMYENVTVLDVASMHPSSIIALNLFGQYTKNFADIVYSRIAAKHNDAEALQTMLGGSLKPYLGDEEANKALAYAMKIIVNMIYGFTSASFENPFRDPRNTDNIVAKRGALFMIDLKHEVQERGFTVAHIKTDSIKIPNATPEIVQFVIDFGKKYDYTFEVENTTTDIEEWLKTHGYAVNVPKNAGAYAKFCLVNDAVYVARVGAHWEAVGAQFQHPVVFKKIFSHEEISFEDYFETKSVKSHKILKFKYPESTRFIGKIGQFVPVIEGGGELLRIQDNKPYAVTGTKGYLWEEARLVTDPGQIDMRYYEKLIEGALATIAKFGDPTIFTTT
jgi:energy-coupling factor transporter ATP-binding protein EcfA2